MKFNVVIPTKNRKKHLEKILNNLNQQAEDLGDFLQANNIELNIIVNDNNSGEYYCESMTKVTFFSRSYDVGGNHNWILSIADFQCDFVWTLVDNMPVAADALQKVLAHTLRNKNADCIIFDPRNKSRDEKTICYASCLDFLNDADHLGPLVHISSMVISHSAFIENISDIILYQNTCFPQFIYQIFCLNKGTHCLIYENLFNTEDGVRKNLRDVYAVSALVCHSFDTMELFLTCPEVKAYKRLVRNTRRTWLTPQGVIYELCKVGQSNSFLDWQWYRLVSRATSIPYTGFFRGLFWRCAGSMILGSVFLRNIYITLYEVRRGFAVDFRSGLRRWSV